MKKILPYLLIFSALSVSISAAYYSIFGLSKLFSGEATAVIIMASTLEFAKILITVILHNYWTALSSWLKTYFILTVIILVIITSQGIYGFLSNAYQLTASKDMQITKQIELVELKRNTFQDQKEDLIKEKDGVISSIEQLRNSLGNNILQTVDKKTGQLIKTTSEGNRKTYERQLDDAVKRRDKISDQINILSDSITNCEIQIINIQNSSSVSSELGPLKYLSNLTGHSMDKIVNWFLLLLIIVFDPLAIALILGASSIFNYKASTTPHTLMHNINNIEDNRIENIPDIIQNNSLKEESIDSFIQEYYSPNKKSESIETIPEKKIPLKTKEKKNKEPKIIYEPFEPEEKPTIKKKEVMLHPEQIRNMSHQQVRKFLKENLES